MRISPSRREQLTVPISRMYMRTGSVVRQSSARPARERGRRFLDGFLRPPARKVGGEQRLGVRWLLVHRMPMSFMC